MAHGGWEPSGDRRDPIDLIVESNRTRDQNLVPLRYERMAASPFAFLRGSALVMAHDLATMPSPGIDVRLCGDAHVANFGIFASPEREMFALFASSSWDIPSRLRQRPEIAIVLLGDGKEKPALMKRAVDLGLDNVHFLPPVPKTDMPQALAAADACIAILKPIPLYATVYPNKVFDYMAAGRPVVLAIDGVIREVIEAAGAGIYTPAGDVEALANAILSLADDPQAGRAMGVRGRQAVEQRFDRAALAEDLARLMEEMTAE
jgi:hypothetical protein